MMLLQLFVIAALGVIAFFCYQTFQPQLLGDIEGRNSAKPVADLNKLLDASVKLQRKIEISEEELNIYIKKRLRISQGGSFRKDCKAQNVLVRLTDGQMEVIIERTLRGKPHTVSMFLETATRNDQYGRAIPSLERTGARLGQLKLPPAYVLLVQESFIKIKDALKKELDVGFDQMGHIEFLDGKLILNPNRQVVSPQTPGNL